MKISSVLRRQFFWVGLTLLFCEHAVFPCAQAQAIQWTRQFGTPSDDQGWEVAADSTGVYVAGITLGSLPGHTNAGNYDAFLRKYDFAGNLLWTRQFGTATEDQARSLAADATGVYVAGHTGGALPGQTSAGGVDAYIRKYDIDGNEVWTRQFGTASADSASGGVALDSTGVYVTGFTGGVFPGQSNAGQSAVFVRKYDFDGNELWTQQFGTPTDDNAQGLVADSTGVYVAGYTNGTLSGQSNSGGYDAFVRKYDPSGNELWTRQFGTGGTDLSKGLAVDSSGVYIPGHTDGTFTGQSSSGGNDAFLRKYDSSGTELWTRQFGTAGPDFAQGAVADSTGVRVAGYVGGALPGQSSSGGSDIFVRTYDPNGTEVDTLQVGGSGNDLGQDITALSELLYVAGYTDGTLPGQTSEGSNDAFVVRLDGTGPATSNLDFSVNPVPINNGTTLTANVDDSTTGGSTIASAEYNIDGGSFIPMTAADSLFDEVSEDVLAAVGGYSTAGLHTLCVRGTDSAGNTGVSECVLLVVYDPNGGFVTGGGSVDSPADADLANGVSGPARFGFVSKYLPGRNTPDGNLEFQFQAGDLNFKSTSMDWLVVTGEPRGRFQGTGKINGSTECKFVVDAWDASYGGADAFGLRLFACGGAAAEIHRYNLPATPLTKGSIIIHRR